ncbi:MAG: hypothetical protein U0931_24590 [Vulcanimicrobiota bacterium]
MPRTQGFKAFNPVIVCCDMNYTLAILGFERAVDRSLRLLLGSHPGLSLAGAEEIPDILLFVPRDVESVKALRVRYPRTKFLAVLGWHRREQFQDAPIDDFIDFVLGYQHLLERIAAACG